MKDAEAQAKRVEQQIADRTAIAKTLETLRTSVSPAGREALERLQQAQEKAAQAIKDQIRVASVTPTPVPPTTDADRIKDDPNGPFKRNDRNGMTAHEALVRIAKVRWGRGAGKEGGQARSRGNRGRERKKVEDDVMRWVRGGCACARARDKWLPAASSPSVSASLLAPSPRLCLPPPR